jgi:hypothetical protein
MTQDERTRLDEVARIAKRQTDELAREIEDALSESTFDSDYYGEIRGMIYRFVALTHQQYEERALLYEILRKGSTCDPTSSKTDSPSTPTNVT